MLPQAFAHSLQNFVLPDKLLKKLFSSLMVFKVPSFDFKLSGDSAEASGVVPHDESRPPLCDIVEAGDAVMEVADPVLFVFWP